MRNYNLHKSNNRGYNNQEDSPEKKAKDFLQDNQFHSEWITKGADESMIVFAEKAGKFMVDQKFTNSKIRNFYGEVKRIQMGTFEKEKQAFYLLRPKIAYALGRELTGGNKNKCAGLYLFKMIFDETCKYVKSQQEFNNLSNLLEAVLAYHRANGGKQNQ